MNTQFTKGNTCTTWQIINVQAKWDIIALDSGLNESYIKLLEDRKILTISYNTFISQYQSIISQTDISIQLTRSLTRLNLVFVSLWKYYAAAPRTHMLVTRIWNDFFSPLSISTINGINEHSIDCEFQCQVQIGSKLCPEYPIRSHQASCFINCVKQ